MRTKRNIAIVAGGDSSEYQISLQSAEGLLSYIDKSHYNLYTVLIHRKKWQVLLDDNQTIEIDKNDFSFSHNNEKITIDFAYITIHGTPGENGILQGYFDLIGIPYSTSNLFVEALTFNKFALNHYLKGFGINVAKSIVLRKNDKIDSQEIARNLGMPCFVKPCDGGSSFGVTKIQNTSEIEQAVSFALQEGNEAMIESFVKGTEVTCGCYKTKNKETVFPVSEVVILDTDFFDFDSKYKGKADEITPARISNELTKTIQNTTSRIYDILGCNGIIRVDYIITPENQVYMLEVNTTPGMTSASFIPQQVAAAGLNIADVLYDIIEDKFLETI